MVRFLHTADWQLGAKLSLLGDRAHQARETRFASVGRIIELAREQDVDFILVAGDLFEDHAVGNNTVNRAVDMLARSSAPVYVLPGNHDPLVAGGIWDREVWRSRPDHIQLLDEPRPVQAGDALLLPCPLTQKRSRLDPTEWLASGEQGSDDMVRVGVAHGALDVLGRDVNFPIAGDRAYDARLDYLALGDWHSVYHHDSRTHYSGTHEPTSFDERDPGKVLIAELSGPGAEPSVTEHRVGRLRWESRQISIEELTDIDDVVQAVSSIDEPEHAVLRLKLTGSADLAIQAEVDRLNDRLSDTVFHMEVDATALLPEATTDVVLRGLPEGPVLKAGEDLMKLLQDRIPDGVGRQYADTDRRVVSRAVQLLYRVAREVGAQ